MTPLRLLSYILFGAIGAWRIGTGITQDWNPGHWAPEVRAVAIFGLAPSLSVLAFVVSWK